MGVFKVWLGVALALAEFAVLPHHSEGACVYQGSLLADATIWKPDSCQNCRCHGDIVICKPAVCRNPQCDFEKGEALQIAANQCCPECVSTTRGSCHHSEKIRAHGTEWAASQCSVCSCTQGEVRCSPQPCPPLSCEHQELEFIPDGSCCPICVGPGKPCSPEGHVFQDGEDWPLSRCAKCVCRDGVTQCFTAQCQPLFCNQDETVVRVPGKCCPQCSSRSCSAAGQVHEHGAQWKENACTTCICDRGEVRCHREACPPLRCEKGQRKAQHHGECCEQCVSPVGSCSHNGIVRYQDEMWKGLACEFCICDHGQVTCHTGECAKVECAQGEELIHLDGKCCPECISRNGYCVYEENAEFISSNVSTVKHIPEGEKWEDGPCRVCECRRSQVTCYEPSCPPCPVATLAQVVKGRCCPECTSVHCHPDCLTCSQSPDHCDLCQDPTKLLRNGRCVHSCGPGFYQAGAVCVACQPQCSTCAHELECSSCWPPLLMRHGQCVSTCGDGFYQDHHSCAACDPSCKSCGPNSPRCLSCAEKAVLHDGKCISACPGGYYTDATGRCKVCHDSCARCSGPRASHCTACTHPQALRQGHCLPNCGEGFFPDGGVCKACHSSCWACVGPERSQCTQCKQPEEGLQAEQLSGANITSGECLPQCRAQFYLENTGLCEACHQSCFGCAGRSPQNCTACWPSHVLMDGQCLSHCPDGYFNQQGSCAECHPTCRQCHGPSESDCISCHPHVTVTGGNCRTSCKEEQFLNLMGYCADCHPLCQQCAADLHNTGSICLRCQNTQYLLLGDHCVPDCPSGYYAEEGACKKCHPSCRTCQGRGPFSCSSCDTDLILSHFGTCSTTCFPGHYLDDNHACQSCSTHCRSCDSPASCTSCQDPNKVLLSGKCQLESCAPQYYLDLSTKACKECDWSCSACDGPLRTDCLQCMDGYVLQDGACVEQCAPTFYRDSGLCKSCDSHCLQCQGPHECTRCEEPFLLLEAHCVQECGKGYFADHENRKCTACPQGCSQCSHRNQCHRCDHGFLLKSGLCVASCVPGFSAHPPNRTCAGKIHTPGLHVNGSLTLAIGSMTPLDFSLLNVQDQDGRVEDLLFHVVSTPTNGQLVLSRNGKEVQLDKASHFSWKDVNEKKVRFVHSKEKPRKGYFSLKISDQQFFSEPQLINIQAFSTQPPYVLRNEALHISRGERGTITTQLLDIRDDDNPQDVVVEVLDPPLHGQLLQTLQSPATPVYQFRLDGLSRGFLHYAHDGLESTSDVAVLQASDGHSFQNILFHVKIVPKNDRGLRLTANSVVWVPEGGMLQFTNRILQAEAPGASASEIIYKITQDHPHFGEVVLLVNMPADSPTEGQPLPDGRTATPTSTFTQQDINDGVVWYRHSGVPAQSDSFRFQVSSAADAHTYLESRTFNIAILPQTPEAPQLSLGASLHMTAREDDLTVIQPHSLSFANSKKPSGKIIYNITLPLHPNQGIIEHRDQPHSPIQYFTQEDINQGKIMYRPPTAAPHLQEIMAFSFAGLPESVKFHFTVSDGEHTSPEMALTIHLVPSDRRPPLFRVTAPLLEVSPGGSTPVGLQLVVRDAETAPEELLFELRKPPQHGVLLKDTTEFRGPMATGDTFTHKDIEKNVLRYLHDGSSVREDSMEISVTDGISVTTVEVRVEVSLPGDRGPRLATGASLSLTVASKSTAVITRSHLAYVDDSSPDAEIWIQLRSLPMYGTLLRTSGPEVEEISEVANFTMEDINNKKIRYSAVFETDGQLVTDSFRFSVSDVDHNRLDHQTFTILITPVKNPPPVIAFADLITVDEGGRTPLSFHHFFAADDHDNLQGDAVIRLSALPMFGCIENTGTGDRFGPGTTSDLEASFPIQDVLENYIYYFQSVHESIEPTHDIFSFYVSDGNSRSEIHSINITIESKNDEPPRMTLRPLRVQLSSGVVISNFSLSLQDLDTSDNELIFVLTKKPEHGHLLQRQTAAELLENGRILDQGSSFTYQDILGGLVGYMPRGPGVAVDEFQFSLTDGLHMDSGRMEIHIELPIGGTPQVAVNQGLQLSAGSTARITEQHLKVTDTDSDESQVTYIVKEDPRAGRLQMVRHGNLEQISVRGPIRSFTQADLSQGQVEYSHRKGESGGNFVFKFDVVDGEGNRLIGQSFSISVLEDKSPPVITTNKGLVLDENSVKKITTLQLSATDQESGPAELTYRITRQPQLGHLEHAASPGIQITSFTQADLTSRNVQYIHSSESEKYSDAFSFTLSDGVNEVTQIFHITIRPVDDSLPIVQNLGMRVQEGVRKTITEFELKAVDADTEAESVTFTIVQPPRHGAIERTTNGQQFQHTSTFTMEDVYQNRVSYSHDGSNSLKDRFTFTVADGTNPFFVIEEGGKEIMTAAPQQFQVDILPVDDGTPRIVTNLGLQWLEYMDGKATNLITKKELLTMDPDTEDLQLVYEITRGPQHGHMEHKLQPGRVAVTFTQEDVNLGLIRYVLHEEKIHEMMDSFQFLVKDSKPNVVSDNVFHIQWSLISFKHTSYNVSEKAGSVSVTVQRTGNLNQYAIVLCRTEQGTASSSSRLGSQPGQQDYMEYAGQVQFDEREDTKSCTIVINDDDVFENVESFTVELSMPAYALLGEFTQAKVIINDTEDEPTLEFDKKTYRVNESAGFLFAPIERKGDSSSSVSVICYTIPKSAMGSSLYALESGSDFKSRGKSADSRVIFRPGITMSTCDIMLIDDSEYEEEEEFEIALAGASDNARVGRVSSAKVLISGPNDASTVSLGNTAFTVSEDAGTVKIPVIRHGTDLSTFTSVWCATRPSDPASATPGVDYIPSSRKVEFRPGVTEQDCTLTILDDTQYPVIEGLETFVVFLSSAQGAELTKPFQAIIAINDTFQDVPSMQFAKDLLLVKEKEGVLHVPIIRSGDLSYESSVRCYTQSHSAQVMEDFEERRNADSSRITFLKGEKMKNCSVFIHDDSMFEPEEQFRVYLGHPLGNHWSGARVGKNNMATVTISNDEDAPTIEFEEAAYQVREPSGPDATAILNIKVIRRGDQNRTSKVRCSTRDGSAQSGVDYYPKSRVLKFSPGVDHIFFKVEILSNEDREWHESFSVVLGPDDPVEAVLGEVTTATVTILDQEAAGSLILPAPPIVVTLADYDHVEEVAKEGVKKSPSPGYPLVCVTPCDPHFPRYAVTRERCSEAGINQTSVQFSWEVAAPTDGNGARSPFETITDNTPFTSVNHMVLDSIYFSRRFHVRCVAKAVDKVGHVGTPLRSNIVTIGTDSAICHTPVVAGTARGFQAQSFIATLKYLDVKHKEHPNRIHISVQIPHQDGMLPLISTMPLHNLHFLLSESIYRHQHVCSNLVTTRDLRGIAEAGFLDDRVYDSAAMGPGYDRPFQFDPSVREPKTIQLYKHLNLKSCVWTFDAYYDMTELIDVCGGSVTADFQVRDSAQSFLTVHVPLYVSYIYVTAPRGWASLEHHTEMEFSFFYDTVLWRTGIQTDSVLSARLQILRIYIREDGRLVIEFKTHAKFRGQFVMEHHTLPEVKSFILTPDHLGGIEFGLQLLWSAQTFDSPYQLWRATSSYNRKDYSGEYTICLIPCTVQPTQPWVDPGEKPLACTAHAPERFLIPIAFQQTNRPVPVVYSLNTEFQLCNNEKVFLMDPNTADMSLAEMDYKGAFSKGQILYGRVLWNPEQNLNSAYKLQLEKVYLCTGKDGYVPFFDPTGTIYNEGPQYGCIQPNKYLKHRFLLLDRSQPEVTDKYFHDVPFEAHFASDLPDFHVVSSMPGVDGFTLKVDALYKVEAGHQWYLQVIYIIGPDTISGPRVQRSLTAPLKRNRRDLVDPSGRLTLDDSLIYDNEGDQVKNGTNMKSLNLEIQEPVVAASLSQTGASIGSALAAIMLLLLVFLVACFITRKCQKQRKKPPAEDVLEEYPLNTKLDVPKRSPDRVEKNVNRQYCTVRNVNILSDAEGAYAFKGAKVKKLNLEVRVHNNLQDGTEV
ncbi:extracellular matrix organizing protein FRAS1 isoform X3 [Phyllostomus hastatus]|uniref:extracellular matrix organizing protein FRAS1 isoform X3 n=1 Tax=Phyllostomus hastatus TaxID=9423 RepID=UPI001E681E58|nr:extracellular matrix organizing protein FRAS1 isoform X3 [Phyllostomus hastatus]